MSNNNHPLPKPQRTQLENTVKAARDFAEKAASAALVQLAVADGKAPDYLTEPQRVLRRQLRSHARALGDVSSQNSTMGVQHLVWEVAYEHWHRMLFARFLAENGLLLWEPGAAVSLEDCEALVQEADPSMNLGAKTKWELAGKLAARMLPQVFKPQSPVFELAFAPEHQRELERLLGSLSPEVFMASDSLGWVYQFWQAKRKDEVNASEVKIGADELPAVTQLFTEPYMVDFLLHNSLGAWWQTRHPAQTCPVPLTYLRSLDDGTPAAGKFEGWPNTLAEFKLLDPCCGSGHFLVAAFLMLVPMRMAAEGLSAEQAVDAVLAHNLHGLEIDARCVEIAVFALALAAWRFHDGNGDPLGVRAHMPAPQVACCGLKLNASADEWTALISPLLSNKELLAQDLKALQANFAQAPLLGSLLDPARFLKDDLATSNVDALRELVAQALAGESTGTPTSEMDSEREGQALELALAARGLLDAARLLSVRYHLVITNVPYLARGKQNDTLKNYCETHYPEAKNDLANVFLERCLELAHPPQNGQGSGVVQIVMPQNWLFLTSYKKQRESLLKRVQWNLLARLGPGAFETISGEVVQAVLLNQTRAPAGEDFDLRGVDASPPKGAQEKAALLREGELVAVSQKGQLGNPDARISLGDVSELPLLERFARSYQGITTGAQARSAILAAEKEHGTRRDWLWSRMGQAPLAVALQHLARLAELSAAAPIGYTPTELALNYQQSGWLVDDAATRALGAVQSKADSDAVGTAVRAIYLPWLEEAAQRLQEATKASGGLPPIDTDMDLTASEAGVCTVFVDGLRYDVAQRLQAKLQSLGTTKTGARWTSMPSVTASGKAWCSPVAKLVSGSAEDVEFEPRVAADSKPLSGHNFRKLLLDNGVQPLDKHETGDPSGRGWTEAGDLDHYGHENGIRLARDVDAQLAQVVERVQELVDTGWRKVRIVTDHGWLLIPGGMPKTDLLKHQAETRWGRCAVLKDTAYGTPLTFGWDWCKAVQVAYAPGVSSFIAGAVYAHGGISLQECLVPVIQLDCAGQTGTGETVSIESLTWKGLRCTVVVKGALAGMKADLRTKAAMADSSLASNAKALEGGKASLAVADDDHMGQAATVVILGADGQVVQKQATTVGEQ